MDIALCKIKCLVTKTYINVMLNHFVSQLQLTTSQAMETLEMVSLN